MKIHAIEITNYKAFLGTYELKIGGKNLFVYGENGSGKSSLYYALRFLSVLGGNHQFFRT